MSSDDVTEKDFEIEVWAECSDEEEMDKLGISYGQYWSPRPEELVTLYDKITKKELELEWKCPVKRKPNEEVKPVTTKPEETKPAKKGPEPEADDFDFEEESTPQLRRLGKSPALKGGAKKRTTSLAGILSNMQRHRIMDQKESEDQPKSQPSTPSTSTK